MSIANIMFIVNIVFCIICCIIILNNNGIIDQPHNIFFTDVISTNSVLPKVGREIEHKVENELETQSNITDLTLHIRACYGIGKKENCDFYGDIMPNSDTYKILKDDFCLVARKKFKTMQNILVSTNEAIIKNKKITNYKFVIKTVYDLENMIEEYKREWNKCPMLQICIAKEDVDLLKV